MVDPRESGQLRVSSRGMVTSWQKVGKVFRKELKGLLTNEEVTVLHKPVLHLVLPGEVYPGLSWRGSDRPH